LIAFIIVIAIFFTYNWTSEITKGFSATLKSTVVSVAETINASDIKEIHKERNNSNFKQSELYLHDQRILQQIEKKLPIENLYVVAIEPVQVGEPVLLDQPSSETNQIYDGENRQLAYRQVYLLDANPPSPLYDYSESGEHSLYFTKQPMVTPIYQGRGTNQQFMTAYAPILDDHGMVIALVGADVNLQIFERMRTNAILAFFLTACVAIALVILTVSFFAHRISTPVQTLKNAALTLAAGDYEEPINVNGPKEIVELSNTLNTMRECLLEQITRLNDTSLARERLYGEYECSQLLQYYMLEKGIEEFHDNRIAMKHIGVSSAVAPRGLLLHVRSPDPNTTDFLLKEAKEDGFVGMYHLLQDNSLSSSSLQLTLHHDQKIAHLENQEIFKPLIWSIRHGKFYPDGLDDIPLEKGDCILIANQGLRGHFSNSQHLKEWFSKVLRQFARERFDLLTAMLNSELNYLTRKQHVTEDIHIVCVVYKG
jgi:HAMP domain-containing protein